MFRTEQYPTYTPEADVATDATQLELAPHPEALPERYALYAQSFTPEKMYTVLEHALRLVTARIRRIDPADTSYNLNEKTVLMGFFRRAHGVLTEKIKDADATTLYPILVEYFRDYIFGNTATAGINTRIPAERTDLSLMVLEEAAIVFKILYELPVEYDEDDLRMYLQKVEKFSKMTSPQS